MKRLKTFEIYKVGDKLLSIKKYIIWRYNDELEILKVLKTNEENIALFQTIPVKHLYNYYLDSGKLSQELSGETTGIVLDQIEENIKKYCMYQSDSLQDCVDTVQTIANTIKYNL